MKSLMIFFQLLIPLVLFLQCEYENPRPLTGGLKEVKTVYPDNPELNERKEYSYDDSTGILNGVITLNEQNEILEKYTFSTDAEGNLLSDTTVINRTAESKLVKVYSYENDRLNTIHEKDEISGIELTYSMFYNQESQLSKIEINRKLGANLIQVGKGEFYWQNGNLIKFLDNLDPSKIEEYEYQYSSEYNYLHDILSLDVKLLAFNPDYMSKNELRGYKSRYTAKTYKVDYEYDDGGRPLAKKISELQSGNWVLTSITSFAYADNTLE